MGDKVGENPAALRAAVFLLSAKNRRGGCSNTPPPAGRRLNKQVNEMGCVHGDLNPLSNRCFVIRVIRVIGILRWVTLGVLTMRYFHASAIIEWLLILGPYRRRLYSAALGKTHADARSSFAVNTHYLLTVWHSQINSDMNVQTYVYCRSVLSMRAVGN